ncbi:MAG: ATP-binding cassette domain-containing protein [Planctomycetes bacterium]|nr:ATP-binding cassette domain-containing protein [Planctomycetota bacterium]
MFNVPDRSAVISERTIAEDAEILALRAPFANVSFLSDRPMTVFDARNYSVDWADGKPVVWAGWIAWKVEPGEHIALVGRSGAGKTTLSAKLALDAKKNKKAKVLLVAADIYRPAAIQQLQTLGEQIEVEVFTLEGAQPDEAADQSLLPEEFSRAMRRFRMAWITEGQSDSPNFQEMQAAARELRAEITHLSGEIDENASSGSEIISQLRDVLAKCKQIDDFVRFFGDGDEFQELVRLGDETVTQLERVIALLLGSSPPGPAQS